MKFSITRFVPARCLPQTRLCEKQRKDGGNYEIRNIFCILGERMGSRPETVHRESEKTWFRCVGNFLCDVKENHPGRIERNKEEG